MKNYLVSFCLLMLLLLLEGCSGTSSMQVTVDVYNGPLSKQKETQAYELLSIAETSGCLKSEENSSLKDNKKIPDANVYKIIMCGKQFVDRAITYLNSYESLHVAEVKKDKKDKEGKNVETTTLCDELVYVKSGVALFCGSVGRQLIARADVLLKQYDGENQFLFPLSTYLKDASTDAFTNSCLINPARCELPSVTPKTKNHNIKRYSNTNSLMGERLRLANVSQSILEDQYWTEVNKVQANGAGTVRMAFIKDDIGNWSLKSFSGDAAKLVKAYNDFAVKTLATAAKLASGDVTAVTDKISNSEKLLNFSDRLAFGEATTLDDKTAERYIGVVKAQTLDRLKELKASWVNEIKQFKSLTEGSQAKLVASCKTLIGVITPAPDQTICDNTNEESSDAILVLLKNFIVNIETETQKIQGAYLYHTESILKPRAQAVSDATNALDGCESDNTCKMKTDTLKMKQEDEINARASDEKFRDDISKQESLIKQLSSKYDEHRNIILDYKSLLVSEKKMEETYQNEMNLTLIQYGDLLVKLQQKQIPSHEQSVSN